MDLQPPRKENGMRVEMNPNMLDRAPILDIKPEICTEQERR